MSYLWSVESLQVLTKNPSPKVRAWACEKLMSLYGKAGVGALGLLLKDKNKGVLGKTLDYLIEHPASQFADMLLDIYKGEKGFIAGKAAMALAKLKDYRIFNAFSEKVMGVDKEGFEELLAEYEAMGELKTDEAVYLLEEAVNTAGDKTDPDSLKLVMTYILNSGKGIDFVLDYYLRNYKHSGVPVVSALLDHCLFWHDDEELYEGKKGFFRKRLPPVVENAASSLKANAGEKTGNELERLFRKKDFIGVINSAAEYADSLLNEVAAHAGEKAFSEWKSRDSQTGRNYNLLTALKNLPLHPKDAAKGLACAAMASLALLEEMKSLIGLSADSGAKALLDSFLEDREDTVDDRWIEETLLNSPDRDTVVDEVLRFIKCKPYSLGTRRGIKLLGLIGDERAIPCLIELISRKNDDLYDDAIDEAQAALARFGEKVLEPLETLLKGSDNFAIMEALFVLRDIPVKRTTDILLRNWERLMTIDRENFVLALEGAASKEFIPLLSREIKEGELVEAETFHLLCLIHGVKDPLLPEIEKELKEHEEEVNTMIEFLEKDDKSSLLKIPLRLELKCLDCKRSYSYRINEVVIDPGRRSVKPQITDMITCKNCGSVNNYEMTGKGMAALTIHAAMMTELMKEGRIEDPMALPVKFMKMRFMGNKPMSSMKEAMEEYKKALDKSPHDPALRIGYGNMLKRQGMLNEAELQFQEAARLEPNAVEAFAQLGEIAEQGGDIHAAHDFYAKALQRMPDARYFRTPDVEGFKEMVVEKHHYLKEQSKTGRGANLIEDVVKVEPRRKKVGRNAPCPCGSGKKYKKCCLSKDESAGRKTAVTPVEKSLTDRLAAFSFLKRFEKDFKSAYLLYFNKPFREPLVMDEGKETEFGAFMEWFIHDHLLESEKTVVEEFYQENFRKLTGEEKAVLEAEMVSYPSVYEVTAVAPEEGISLRDLFTGEEFEVKDVKGSRLLVKWDIAITRVIRHETSNKLSGLVTLLPRDDKERFMSALSEKWEEFKKETGMREWKAFMKKRGYLLFRIYNERMESTPVPFTEEQHRVVDARAEFNVLDFQGIRRLLSNEFDFVLDEEKEGRYLRYTWLKRGKSEKWENGQLPKSEGVRPIIIQSQLINPAGEIRFTTLGIIRATTKALTLECISKERLERGKTRLEEVLGNVIKHGKDTFEDFESSGGKREKNPKNVEAEALGAQKISLMSGYYSQYVEEWISSPIQALGGLSPLESCKTEAGISMVEELLKDMENHEERKRKDGQPYMDVNKIRERLKTKISELQK